MGKWEFRHLAEIGFLMTETKLTEFDAVEELRRTYMDVMVLKLSLIHFKASLELAFVIFGERKKRNVAISSVIRWLTSSCK